MTDNVTVVRYNDKLLKTDQKIEKELMGAISISTSTIQHHGATKALPSRVSLTTCFSWHASLRSGHTTGMKAEAHTINRNSQKDTMKNS